MAGTTWPPAERDREREGDHYATSSHQFYKGPRETREREKDRLRSLKESGGDHLATNPKS